MNGTGGVLEQRQAQKRMLEVELEAIRGQKAEVLKAIQQISKKQKLGGPPPKHAALTHEAKVEAERRNHHEQQRRVWSMCTKIIQEILKNSQVKLYFGEPVHRDKFPTYYEVIKKPIDLGTIKGKIERGMYSHVDEFVSDMRLCFENCRTFNPIGFPVRKLGDSASDQFERKWSTRNIPEEWAAEQQRHSLAMARLEAEAKTLPDKVKEVDAELQSLAAKAAARHKTPPPGPGRDMTFEEKRKLSHSMGTIPGERLARVLEIVAAGPSAALLQGEEEFELDVDALDAATLWKLQAYVDSVIAEADNKAARPGAAATAMAAAQQQQQQQQQNEMNNGGGGGGNNEGGMQAGGAGGGGAAPGGGVAAAAANNNDAVPMETGGETQGGNTGSEEVGSKGAADSTGQRGGILGGTAAAATGGGFGGGRAADMTTFVSATGPGAQPAILRNSTQKKDVQLQNPDAWASLQQQAPGGGGGGGGAAPPNATGGGGGGGNTMPAAGMPDGTGGNAVPAPAAPAAAAAAAEALPAEDDDTLWTEFQGRETQQQAAEEQKKALEEAEKARAAEEKAAAERAAAAAAEADARRAAEAQEVARRAEEERREREAAELRQMGNQGAAEAAAVAAPGGAAPADVGLVARQAGQDEEDAPMDV